MRDQAVGGVSAGGHPVPRGAAALAHQGHHLIRGVRELDIDLAAGLIGERRDPVHLGIGLSTLYVAGPGHEVQRTLPGTDALLQIRPRPGG